MPGGFHREEVEEEEDHVHLAGHAFGGARMRPVKILGTVA
jgi:hypothetical protein